MRSTTSTSKSSFVRCCDAFASPDVDDTNFLIDEQVEKNLYERENERVIEKGAKPAEAEALLLRHHEGTALDRVVHLGFDFPGDYEVLTEAAISGKVDFLRGLKVRVSAHRDRTKRRMAITQNAASRSPITGHRDHPRRVMS